MKKNKKQKHPLVLIEWVDSVQPRSNWEYLSELDGIDAAKCASVGWLVHDGKKEKGICPNIGHFDDEEALNVSGLIVIPTKSVLRITRLKGNSIKI